MVRKSPGESKYSKFEFFEYKYIFFFSLTTLPSLHDSTGRACQSRIEFQHIHHAMKEEIQNEQRVAGCGNACAPSESMTTLSCPFAFDACSGRTLNPSNDMASKTMIVSAPPQAG
jgi:hypothetical protein